MGGKNLPAPLPPKNPPFPMRLLLSSVFLTAFAVSGASAAEPQPQPLAPPQPQPQLPPGLTPGAGDDAARALNDAREFRKKGEFAKALERQEWFHANALQVSPAYYAVRLSYALSDWMVLANQYPPALVSLKRVRDEATKTLEEGKGTPGLFHDVIAINDKFSEHAASIGLFKKLDATQPELAKQTFLIISGTLIDKGELELYAKYVGDPKTYLSREIAAYQLSVTQLSKKPRGDQALAHFKKKLLAATLTLAKIATDKGDPALAAELKEMTNKVAPDPLLAP